MFGKVRRGKKERLADGGSQLLPDWKAAVAFCGRRDADAQTSSPGGGGGEGRRPERADGTVAGGNPPPASLTFSSAASPYRSPRLYSVEGIPLRSALFTASPLLLHVLAYPLIYAANCQHYYFHSARRRKRKKEFPVQFV